MITVSNTSPLINLAWVGKLHLLHDLYGDLLIPEAVWHEIVIVGAGQPGANEVATATWIHVQEVTNNHLVQSLRLELDAGEAEAIALAIEASANLLIMDERLGRAAANHLGVPYIGLVGVLLKAKQAGQIDAIKSILDSLRDTAGFYLSRNLYKRILQDANEV